MSFASLMILSSLSGCRGVRCRSCCGRPNLMTSAVDILPCENSIRSKTDGANARRQEDSFTPDLVPV